ANFFISIAVSFFMMPFLVKHLGDEQYGLWTLVGSFLGYYGLMDFGMSSAVVRFVSRAVGRKDDGEVRTIISTSFYLFLVLGLLSALMTVVIVALLNHFIPTNSHLATMRTLLLLLGLNFAVDFPVRSYGAVLTSNLRDDLGTGIAVIKNVLCSAAIYLVIKNGAGIIGLAVTSVVFSLLDSACRVLAAYRIDKRTTIDPTYVDKSRLRPLFNYSFPTLVGRFASILRFRLDQIVVTAVASLSAVTHYAIGFRLVEYVSSMIGEATGVAAPLFSQDDGANDYAAIRRKYDLLSRVSVYVAVFFCGLLFLYGRRFIYLWMGPGYEDSGTVLMIFLVPIGISLTQASVVPLLYGISKHPFYVYCDMVEGFINLGLSLWLGKKYGMIGVALGTAIPMTIKLIFVQPWYACSTIGLKRWTYGLMVAKNVGLAAIFVMLGWLVLPAVEKLGMLHLGIAAAVHAIIFWPLAIWFGFEAKEKQRFFGIVRQTIRIDRTAVIAE
ncbi:MAG: polysaccharide biosynthesis protein, partial [Elusimicrobia bacterium]|nr:polysaccharide biosynthesis protein [Elusimicrobiota bacterium]